MWVQGALGRLDGVCRGWKRAGEGKGDRQKNGERWVGTIGWRVAGVTAVGVGKATSGVVVGWQSAEGGELAR